MPRPAPRVAPATNATLSVSRRLMRLTLPSGERALESAGSADCADQRSRETSHDGRRECPLWAWCIDQARAGRDGGNGAVMDGRPAEPHVNPAEPHVNIGGREPARNI